MLTAHPACHLRSAFWAGVIFVLEEGPRSPHPGEEEKEWEVIKHLLLPRHFEDGLIEPHCPSHEVGMMHMPDLTLRMWTPGLCD